MCFLVHTSCTRCHCSTITLLLSKTVADGVALLWVNLPVEIEMGSYAQYFIGQSMVLNCAADRQALHGQNTKIILRQFSFLTPKFTIISSLLLTFSHSLAFTRASWVKSSQDWITVTKHISLNDL